MPAESDSPAPLRPATTLLGPQRNPSLDSVLQGQGLYGAHIGLLNSGWQEREADDGLLASLAGGNTVNLRLWQRMQQVWEADPDFAAADRHRRAQLEESQELYLVGLEHTVLALRALLDRNPRTPWVHDLAVQDAENVLRSLDELHMRRVRDIYDSFWDDWPPHQRPIVAAHRARIAELLSGVDAVVIAGGHIGVLLGAMHLFNVAPHLEVPVIAWGAGAMAMSERVVLFHDFAAHGPAMAEVFSSGVGRVQGAIVLPSARERLELSDQARMGIIARRFLPSSCLLLDEKVQVEFGADGVLPPGAPVLALDGSLGVSA